MGILLIHDELYPNTSANARIVYRIVDELLTHNDDLFDKEGFRKYYRKTVSKFYEEMYHIYNELIQLKEFSEWKGLMVYNARESSLIDIFERADISNQNA